MEFKGTKVFSVDYHTTGVLPYKYMVSDIQETDEEAKANAQLIATAPKMLEMLIEIHSMLSSGTRINSDDIYEVINQATKID